MFSLTVLMVLALSPIIAVSLTSLIQPLLALALFLLQVIAICLSHDRTGEVPLMPIEKQFPSLSKRANPINAE